MTSTDDPKVMKKYKISPIQNNLIAQIITLNLLTINTVNSFILL